MDSDKFGVLSIGGSGLVGSRVQELLSDKYSFTTLGRKTGLDITNSSTLRPIETSNDKIVIHFAAKTDVDSCEQDKNLGKDGEAWKINVIGVENVINVCKKTNKKLIYISTDFVFGSMPPTQGGFIEEDTPAPVNWYGQTKYEGEKLVESSGLPYLIARIAYPYRGIFDQKVDFVRVIKNRLENKKPIAAITDHIMTPTFIDDIAFAIEHLITTEQTGIFHVVGGQFISPYDAAMHIAQNFDLDQSLISKTTREEFFKNRAPRPLDLSLKNDKIQKLGIPMKSFDEGLFALK